MTTFRDFLVQKLSDIPSVKNAYGSHEEMLKHFESGEVTIPFTSIVDYWDEFISTSKTSNILPSQFQYNDKVLFGIQQNNDGWICPMVARVLGVHFYQSKVKYDLEIGIAGESATRIYNIDSCFVQAYSEEAHRCYAIVKDYPAKTESQSIFGS